MDREPQHGSDASTVCRRQLLEKRDSLPNFRAGAGAGGRLQGRSSTSTLRSTASFYGATRTPSIPENGVRNGGMCLREQEQHVVKLGKENWALKLDVTLMKQSRDNLTRVNAGLQESVDKLTRETRSVKEDLAEIRSSLKERERELGEAYQMIDKLHDTVAVLREKLKVFKQVPEFFFDKESVKYAASPRIPQVEESRPVSPAVSEDGRVSPALSLLSESECGSESSSSAGSWTRQTGSRSLFSISESSSSASLRSLRETQLQQQSQPRSVSPFFGYKATTTTESKYATEKRKLAPLDTAGKNARSSNTTTTHHINMVGQKHTQRIDCDSYSNPTSPRRVLTFNRTEEPDSSDYSSGDDIFDSEYFEEDYVRTPHTLSPEPRQNFSPWGYPELYSPFGSTAGGSQIKRSGSRQSQGSRRTLSSASSDYERPNMMMRPPQRKVTSLQQFLAERLMGLSAPAGSVRTCRPSRIPSPSSKLVGGDKLSQRRHLDPISQRNFQRETLERRRREGSVC
ncbi:hypothetical protein DFH27DRAFT_614475 [Peziza echinospora]|nr:hypothetical protein DFH27DRAFT_614475 [Peziza echinospora]